MGKKTACKMAGSPPRSGLRQHQPDATEFVQSFLDRKRDEKREDARPQRPNMAAYRIQSHTRHKSAQMVAGYIREADKWTKSGLDGVGF
jgi:hypothetical protein